MGKEKFEEYLKTQQNTQDKTIDWELKKEEWIKEVETFLEQIKYYFEKYKDIVIHKQLLTINEEYLGSYKTNKLIVKFNNDTVTFTPIGRNIIGAKGRIDMEGKAGKVKFVLVKESMKEPQVLMKVFYDENKLSEHIEEQNQNNKKMKKEKDVWKISTPPPKIKYLELNEDSFFDALMEVING
jgi:hypothetical protein